MATIITTVPAQRPMGEGQDCSPGLFPPCLRRYLLPGALVTGAIVLPWAHPPQLFQTICFPAPHLLSLFKAGLDASLILGCRQQDGESP